MEAWDYMSILEVYFEVVAWIGIMCWVHTKGDSG